MLFRSARVAAFHTGRGPGARVGEGGGDHARGDREGGVAERHLRERPSDQPVTLYACGPEGMLAACARLAARFGRPCEVSVERIMGCGTGACFSCVVPMREEDGVYRHVRSCLAGPVLRHRVLVNYRAEAEGVSVGKVIERVLAEVKA